jgi:cell division protein ZapD
MDGYKSYPISLLRDAALIVYEYPFNERIRTLLRLESLHQRFSFFLHQESPMQHHVALSVIFEMLEVVGRGDLKSDLIQDIDRQKNLLASYQSNPNVASDALESVLSELDRIGTSLSAMQGKTGQHLRENEWLMSIRGRMAIPGGACEFDLPAYYAWQQKSAQQRFDDISKWFQPMVPFFDAVNIVIRLLRDSAHNVKEVSAPKGSFQQMLHGKTYQMLRLAVDENIGAIPEISANKYVLMIRFIAQTDDLKPKPFEDDVPFELTLCGL